MLHDTLFLFLFFSPQLPSLSWLPPLLLLLRSGLSVLSFFYAVLYDSLDNEPIYSACDVRSSSTVCRERMASVNDATQQPAITSQHPFLFFVILFPFLLFLIIPTNIMATIVQS